LKSILAPLLFVVLATLVEGCTYELEGDYYEEIDQNVDPGAVISLNDITAETFTIYKSTTFGYNYSTQLGQFKSLEIFWDDNSMIGVSFYSGGQFTVPLALLTTGTHNLKIFVTATSGTGSLADLAGAEERQVWKEWTVEVDMTPPPIPNLTFTTENGLLKATWPAHQHPNFVDYQLKIQYNTPQYPFNFDSTITITDPSKNFFVNPWYVGRYPMTYQVLSHSQEHTVISQPTYALVSAQDYDLTLTGEFRSSDSTVLLQWNKAPFPGAFKHYRIWNGDGNDLLVTNVGDTSLRVRPPKVLFGLPISYNLLIEAVSHYSPSPFNNYSIPNPIPHLKIYSGQPGAIDFNVTHNRIASQGSFLLLRLYDANFQKVDSVYQSWYLSMPYEGDFIYYSDNEKIMKKHLGTGHVTVYDVITSDPLSSTPNVFLSGSTSNSLVVYAYWVAGAPGFANIRRVNVHNLATNELVSQFTVDPSTATYKISAFGKYLLTGNNIYEYVGSALEFRWAISSGTYLIGLMPDNEEQIILLHNQSVTVNNMIDGTLVRTIPVPTGYVYTNYDPVTHSVFFTQAGSEVSYAINIVTLEQTDVHALNAVSTSPVLYGGFYFEWLGDYFKAIP
jgi:hypothetical protein